MKQSTLILYSVLFVLVVSGLDTSWARKPQKAAPVATSSGTQSTQQVYDNLLNQQRSIGEQISALSLKLHSASAPQGRKITNQINLLSDDLAMIERKLAAFPSQYTGVVGPNVAPATPDDTFRKELDSITTLRVAASDPFAGQLSADPQLDRMYRAYLNMYGQGSASTPQTHEPIDPSKGVVYRVMVAISKTRLPTAQFTGMPDVVEQPMPAGGYAYYSGQYGSLNEAQTACDQILGRHKFRDAFVVAMDGNRRIPIQK